MHILCIALRYNKPNKTKVSYLVGFFSKTRALVLALGFRYFELRNINEFQEFQYSVMSLFIDNGAGLVLSIWFNLAQVLNIENIL